jgi:ABC-type multidrug transport system fused ATPase/permease subunit
MNETVPIDQFGQNAASGAGVRPGAGSVAGAAIGTVSRGLSVVSIAKSYDRKVVLKDVSLGVERGEVVGLLGPNGAGKTTCFYSVMGLVKPDSGRILLDGQDITSLPMYRRAILGLGYLPQETSIFRGLSVAQNIMAVLEVEEPNRAARAERLEQLLGEFHIEHLRDSPAMSRARSPPIPRSCCSTSRSPASIRSRSPTSALWCCSSSSATSAC